MEIFSNRRFLHHPGNELEGPYRIKELLNDSRVINIDKNGEEYLTLVHIPKYIQKVKTSSRQKQVIAEVQLSPESYEIACLAVGLTIYVSMNNGFAVVRPPGHHAHRERGSGFWVLSVQ